jgi:4-hydroxybenzoate polyprenyltransferase
MGWVAVFGRLDAPAWLLYGGTIAWVVGYDTIYAVQDIEDDAIAGIRSSARTFGPRLKAAIGACYAVAAGLVALAALWAGAGPVGCLGVAGFAAHLGWQTVRLEAGDGRKALMLFRSNRDAGLILFAGLAADAALRAGMG